MSENGHTASAVPTFSFLMADFGHTTTKVALFDVVDGTYQLIAQASGPTTLYAPFNDVRMGLLRAVVDIQHLTGRVLVDSRLELITPSQTNGQGVDYFGCTVSALEPLKTIIVGLLEDVSLRSARRVLASHYTEVVEMFSLADPRSSQTHVNAIRRHKPDLIFLTGGTNGSSSQQILSFAEITGIGITQFKAEERAQFIYAGNNQLREEVKKRLGDYANLHVAENIRPTLHTEQLTHAQQIVGELFSATKLRRVPGLTYFDRWQSYAPLPTVEAVGHVVQYLAAVIKGGVLAVDVGSEVSHMVWADGEERKKAIRMNWGTGRSMQQLRATPIEQITRWLPTAVDPEVIKSYLLNRPLHPQALPTTRAELQLFQAILRELLYTLSEQASHDWGFKNHQLPSCNLLLLCGSSLVHAPRLHQSLLMVLDSLQPVGVFTVAADVHHLLPAAGVLAQNYPMAVVQLLEQGIVQDLGLVVVPAGYGREGYKAFQLSYEAPGVPAVSREVVWGQLEVIPLPAGVTTVTIQPGRGIDVGAGPGKSHTVTTHGGAVGLVLDTRGRPLRFAPKPEEQLLRNHQWLWDMGH